MTVDLAATVEAWRLLGDRDFLDRWEQLADCCPWATTFQSRAFLEIWYDCYREDFDPLIVVGRGEGGELLGLWFLAVKKSTGEVFAAGTHHSEYNGWLSTPVWNDQFIHSALRALALSGTVDRLTLVFLAPGSPVGWIRDARDCRVHLRPHRRGLMLIGETSPTESSLRKKRYRSRLARLRKAGEVVLLHATTRAEFEPFVDALAEHCDLRQGSANNSTPFRSDPRKREFYLRLIAAPGLAHAMLFKVGDQIAGSHVGVIDKNSVLLGLITHSPFLAKHSPGKLMLLLLGRMLSEEGFTRLDLTPGGEYKDQFATDYDEVYVLDIFFDLKQERLYRARRAVTAIVKPILKRAPALLTTSARRSAGRLQRLFELGLTRGATSVFNRSINSMWSSSEYRFYRLEPGAASVRPEVPQGFRVNSIRDLLAYDEKTMQSFEYNEFLRRAIGRLEKGHYVVTYMVEEQLAHYSWLSLEAKTMGSEMGHTVEMSEPGMVLWDDFTAPRFRGRGLHASSLRVRLALAHRNQSIAYIAVAADNGPSRHNIEKVGFKYWRSGFVQRRFGRSRKWVQDVGDLADR